MRLRYLVIALALLAAFASDLWGRSQKQPQSVKPQETQTPTSQQAAPTEPRGTEQSPFIVRTTKSKEEAAQDAKESKDKASNDRINLAFTAIVALATLLQFCALVVIIITTRRQLRAYVFPELDENDKAVFMPDSEVRIPIRARNRGQTPAYRVSQWVDCQVLPYPLVGAPVAERIEEPPGCMDLGPTAQFSIMGQIPRALRPDELAGLRDGTKKVYVFGEIRYRDAFAIRRGKRQPRWTRFRFMVHHGPTGMPLGLMACNEGNEAN